MILNPIDHVEVMVLVDNYTDLLLTDNSTVFVRPSLPYGEVLLAEHGLSLYITLWEGTSSQSILMDTGASKISLRYNAARMGINLQDISALVISHGHDDHVGSLKEILEESSKPVPVYIHPGSFSKRQKRVSGKPVVNMPPLDIFELAPAKAEWCMTSGPTCMGQDRVLITGEIERTTIFERSNPAYYVEKSDTWIPDVFLDDQAVVFNLKGKGLVVITGCAHAGVINSVYYARKITGIDKIYAVIGGFHLSGPFFRSVIDKTISAMQEIDPVYLIPLHCTGWEATTRFMREMPGKVILNTVGSAYRF